MASVVSQLVEEVTAHAQIDSIEDAREKCADGTYFPNNLCKYQLQYIFCWQTPPTTFSYPQMHFGPATEFLSSLGSTKNLMLIATAKWLSYRSKKARV